MYRWPVTVVPEDWTKVDEVHSVIVLTDPDNVALLILLGGDQSVEYDPAAALTSPSK